MPNIIKFKSNKNNKNKLLYINKGIKKYQLVILNNLNKLEK